MLVVYMCRFVLIQSRVIKPEIIINKEESMKKIARVAALSVMAISLTGGVAAASSGSIGTTGPDSTNKVEHKNRSKRKVENNNGLFVVNYNPQEARTGRARVSHNTTGGDAASGDATNDSLLRARVTVDNSGSSDVALGSGGSGSNSGTISNTGPDSYNKIKFDNKSSVKVTNNNLVGVVNVNEQKAKSGSARVSGNTTGGDATSGNASNISTNETTISITN